MGKWLRRIFTEYIAGVLLVITVTVGVPLLAWLQSIPWYLIALSAIGAFCLMFFGINQYHTFQIERKKGLAEFGDKEIEVTIRDWLDDPIFKFQRRQVDSNHFFQFVVTDESSRPVIITRTKLKPTQLSLTTAITLGEKHRQKYETLNSPEKEKVVHTIRIEMARYGIGYSGIHIKLERAVLSDTVLLDNSLTEFYLRQRIFYVTGAFALYSEVIEMALSE